MKKAENNQVSSKSWTSKSLGSQSRNPIKHLRLKNDWLSEHETNSIVCGFFCHCFSRFGLSNSCRTFPFSFKTRDSLLISRKQTKKVDSNEMSSVLNEVLSALYDVREQMEQEFAAFQTYCNSMESTLTEDIETYEGLIEDSTLLISSYSPLLEEDQEEVESIAAEIEEKNLELEDGQSTRESEAAESESTISSINEDISTIDGLLLDLDSFSKITLAQVFDKIHTIKSQSTMTQHIQSTLVSLTDSTAQSEDISTETRDLLVSLLSQLGTEVLSMKELEEQSEEAAQSSWEELESMLQDRVSQLSIRSAELTFQVEMYGILVEDNETQVTMYENRITTLQTLLDHLDTGCTAESSSFELQSEMMYDSSLALFDPTHRWGLTGK